jgi:hypothetical protein
MGILIISNKVTIDALCCSVAQLIVGMQCVYVLHACGCLVLCVMRTLHSDVARHPAESVFENK